MPGFIDITGQRFGKLKVISFVGHNTSNQSLWRCKCECGKITIKSGYFLRLGRTKRCSPSCGTIAEKAREANLLPATVRHRLSEKKWTLDKALKTRPYGGVKITLEHAENIRNDNRSLSKLAIIYGVDPSYISLIKRGLKRNEPPYKKR